MNSEEVINVSLVDETKYCLAADLEAQNVTQTVNKNGDSEESPPLKGIIRHNSPSLEKPIKGFIILKTCSTLCVLIIMVPIIISDLYYGFTDKSCVNREPYGLGFSMKLYLLISGFVEMAIMISCVNCICCLSLKGGSNLKNAYFTLCVVFTSALFLLIINILGAVVFWSNVYEENICDKNISNYLFASLIIKFILNLAFIYKIISGKKD